MSDGEKKKSFKIEAFKDKVVMDPNYADKTWKILESAIHEIYNNNASGLSFDSEDLYRKAYYMVLHKCGEKLYVELVATLTSYLKEISKSIEAAQGGFFLEELNRKWNHHNKAMQMIGEIMMYMDRTYIPANRKTPLHELRLNLWRDNVIYPSQIWTRLSDTLLELTHRERTGEVINRALMRNIVKMLMDLGPSVYEKCFEIPFLEVSAEFYRAESQQFIERCDCGDYLKNAETRLYEEIDRISHYLDARTGKMIALVVVKEMISNHMLTLIHMENSGLEDMLLEDKYEDLGRMYFLFSPIPDGLAEIREVMTSLVRDIGQQFVTDPEWLKDPGELFYRLSYLKEKFDNIIGKEFNNDKTFQNALNSSFEYLINLNPHSPEIFSLWLDGAFRMSLKGLGEKAVDAALDECVVLFRYLQEKHVFEKYHKQHLAKRLLSGKSVSDDAERSFIVKLKTECGYQFTSKLEVMLTDMRTSKDTLQRFYASHPELGDGPTLAVKVLTTDFWPTQPTVTCNLPAEMAILSEKFRSYYLGTHKGRRLSWQTNMGTADIKATFGNGQKHELIVSTNHMCVLMLFNNADRLSYKEIEQATEIPASVLKRCLQSMALMKRKNVLSKEPLSKAIGEGDAFTVNDDFTNKFYRVKIGIVGAQTEYEPVKSETRQRVEADRKPEIEAAVVRIMKSRRQLDHNNLVAEVTKQLQRRFFANPTEIKKRIESLIEREYLERDNSDRRLYRYLA